MRYLVKFDFGLRDAFGEAVEVLDEEELQMVKDFVLSGMDVCLGEINGKHSDVIGPLEDKDWHIISTDLGEIAVFQKLFGGNFGAFCMTEAIKEALAPYEDDE